MQAPQRNHVVDFRKVIGLEGKSARNVFKMKEEMPPFFVSGSVVVLLPL